MGHDAHGTDSHGHDAHGHDAHGHDAHGHDAHGHDGHGHGGHGHGPTGSPAEQREVVAGFGITAAAAIAVVAFVLQIVMGPYGAKHEAAEAHGAEHAAEAAHEHH